ncbi:MAG: SpoIIE family protein phosphatase [Candidatus Izemoplasmatales bacterium]
MNDLYLDYGTLFVPHIGEELCGDQVVIKEHSDNLSIVVLADGLGSGVKANILATMTATMLSTMVESEMDIEDSIHTIATTLPICQVRKVAYSTFTLLMIRNHNEIEMYQYDNPRAIILRNGLNYDYSMKSLKVDGKLIYHTRITLDENDAIILFSDGVTHAGVGNILNFGWDRNSICKYIEENYKEDASSKAISSMILSKTLELYNHSPMDDATVFTLKIRKRKQVNLLVGPPARKEDDRAMLSLFFSKSGKHIVCGGTTANIVSNYLKSPIQMDLNYTSKDIPPTAVIDGVDLVTEGVITVAKVLEYAKGFVGDNTKYPDWKHLNDGASKICQMLFEEATDINFYSGCAVNPAHQNKDLPISFSIKMQLVEELSQCLKKMGKNIKVSYF